MSVKEERVQLYVVDKGEKPCERGEIDGEIYGEGEGSISSSSEEVVSTEPEFPGPVEFCIHNGWKFVVDYIHPLGKGKFGEVFIARRTYDEELFALKIAQEAKVFSKRFKEPLEAEILRSLGGDGAPALHWLGRTESGKVMMLLDLCGKSLDKLVSERKAIRFTLDEVREIGLRCLYVLQRIHSFGYVHGDIKPANFVFGDRDFENVLSAAKTIQAIDFGLAKVWEDERRANSHISYSQHLTRFSGSLRYASLHAHMGRQLSRRDDLESLLYMLLYLLKGPLPWQGFTEKGTDRAYKIFLTKGRLSSDEVCKGCPISMKEYLDYVRSLKFEQNPDYDYLKQCFERMQVGTLEVVLDSNESPSKKRKAIVMDDECNLRKKMKFEVPYLPFASDPRNQWIMIFSKSSVVAPVDNSHQVIYSSKNFQKFFRDIKQKIVDGHYISHFQYSLSTKEWIAVYTMTPRLDVGAGLFSFKKVVHDDLQTHCHELKFKGLVLHQIAAGVSHSCLYECKDDEVMDQQFYYGVSFPRDWICTHWNQEYFVSQMAAVGDNWFVGMTKYRLTNSIRLGSLSSSFLTGQKIEMGFGYPSEAVRTHWQNGFVVTMTCANSSGLSVYVFSKLTDVFRQHSVRTTHMEQNLKAQWEQGYRLTSMCYGRVTS